jgi:hypothetical protein
MCAYIMFAKWHSQSCHAKTTVPQNIPVDCALLQPRKGRRMSLLSSIFKSQNFPPLFLLFPTSALTHNIQRYCEISCTFLPVCTIATAVKMAFRHFGRFFMGLESSFPVSSIKRLNFVFLFLVLILTRGATTLVTKNEHSCVSYMMT